MIAALLRGINVGAHGQLPMKDLVAMFEAAGCSQVTYYLRSGNVAFHAPAAVAKKVPALIEAAVAKRFGFAPAVFLRSADDLLTAHTANPFPALAGKQLHLAFLRDAPALSPAAVAAALAPKLAPDETAVLIGRDLYLAMPNGVGKTKLAPAFVEKQLGTLATWRNWNTVEKLVEMTR